MRLKSDVHKSNINKRGAVEKSLVVNNNNNLLIILLILFIKKKRKKKINSQ